MEKRILLSTITVSPTGSDSNPGTPAAPIATLQQSLKLVHAGDTIHILPGHYAGFILGWDDHPTGTKDAPITFQADQGAVITSRNNKTPDGINIENSSYLNLDGLTIDNAPTSRDRQEADQTGAIDRAGLRIANSSNITLKNITSQNNGTWGIYTSHSDNISIDNCTSSNNNAINPTGWNHHGIYISNSANNISITNCTVSDNFGNGIHLNGDASQGGNGVVSNATIQHNTISNNGKNGGSAINCDGLQNSRILDNTLTNNHAKGIALYRIDASQGSQNNLVQNNRVLMAPDAKGAALVIKNASTANTIQGNLLSSTSVAVVVSEDSLPNLNSDRNTFRGRFSVDSDETRISFAQWQRATKQDANSHAAEKPSTRRTAIILAAMVFFAIVGVGALLIADVIRRRNLNKWLRAYIQTARKRKTPQPTEEIHALICIADHFEPGNNHAPRELSDARVERWCTEYPNLFARFRDSDGRPPRHTFFYPLEQYTPHHVARIADLCAQGFGEIELHLHHDNDTSAHLRDQLETYKNTIHKNHSLLPRDPRTGEIRYAFVHGNWALDNSRPDGRWCGVNDEISILVQTGCYADFTLPSAPDASQINKINSIYYAIDDPEKPCSHATGIDIATAPQPPSSLLMIQGPLLLDWKKGKIENACIQGSQPPTMHRLDLWLKANVHVPTRPDWKFIKLHTHGCPEENAAVLLGSAMLDFHLALQQRARTNPNFHYHYVTAREMYNLAKAAEAGFKGNVNDARNFHLPPAFPPLPYSGLGRGEGIAGTTNLNTPKANYV